MQLSRNGIKETKSWLEKGYELPQFDIEEMKAETAQHPVWVHFGAGNIFRAFHAVLAQELLEAGSMKSGIVVAEGFDYEIIEKMNRPHDELSILMTLKADGSMQKKVVASVAASYALDTANEADYQALLCVFANPSLQMASFTVTEKGYCLVDGKGALLGSVAADFANGPKKPQSYIGKVSSLLYHRYLQGAYPIAMVSTDNCSHNGDKLQGAVTAFAKAWTEAGLAEQGFLEYLSNPKQVSFPWSMIDKITPRPDAKVEEMLKADGIAELAPVITSKNTYVAPFVNAEETQYLVVEDAFPNGRPELEKCGVIFTDKETVDKVERMKVCTCLNPLHTTLAVFGCVLGYQKISDEMQDEQLKKMVEIIGYEEGLPVVTDPGVLNPEEFLDTVLKQRIPNPFMPDTPQRIATDTSQKLPIRFGETIKAYQRQEGKKVSELKLIPLVFAGWIRYLMAIDDEGNAFALSPDPLLDSVCPYAQRLSLEKEQDIPELIGELLHKESIFGVDLYEAGLADMVCEYVRQLTDGTGAVRSCLKRVLGGI